MYIDEATLNSLARERGFAIQDMSPEMKTVSFQQ